MMSAPPDFLWPPPYPRKPSYYLAGLHRRAGFDWHAPGHPKEAARRFAAIPADVEAALFEILEALQTEYAPLGACDTIATLYLARHHPDFLAPMPAEEAR